jgi:hypothetical protein
MTSTLSQLTATSVLVLFLVAVSIALVVTLSTEALPVRILAGAVVSPIVALTVLFLYFEWRGRPWSFAGAAALGTVGVVLRLIVNSQPRLEVSGGLPLSVTVGYVGVGVLLIGTSLWAYLSLRRIGGRAPNDAGRRT